MNLRHLCPRKSIYASWFKNKAPHTGTCKIAWWVKALLDKPGDLRPEFYPWNLQKDRENQRDSVDLWPPQMHQRHALPYIQNTYTHTYPKHWNSPKLVLISLWNNLSKENLGPCRHGSHLPRSCLSPIGNKGVLCSMPICAESPLAYSVDVLWDIYRNDSRASWGGS